METGNIFKLVSEMKDVLIYIKLRSLNDTKLIVDSVYDSNDKYLFKKNQYLININERL